MPKNRLVRALDSRRTARAAVANVASGGGSTTVTLDHGTLTGLADDDHTQYLNNTRGDARYVPLARTVSAGAGLTGGGALSANRTLSLASTVAGAGLTLTNGVLDVVGGNGLTVSANSMAVNAGNGLTFSSGALVVGAGTLITVGSTSVGLSNGTAQYQVPVTGGTPFTPAYTALSTFAGAGLTFTGGQFALASTVAGAGLTLTNGVIDVVGGNGLTVNANNMLVNAGAGLTFATGALVVGQGAGITVNANDVALTTPGTLAHNSSNSSTGSHTHQITSTSNASSASLLASDSNGYLRLVRLGLGMAPARALDVTGDAKITTGRLGIGMNPTRPLDVTGDAGFTGQVIAGSGAFSGSVSITNNGDLTVGTVFQVNTLGTRVGINRAPDQQFDLDVAGAIRGQYLIGKHAIQLESAIGVFHYDGSAPYRLDNTGSSNSHMGVGATEGGAIIYRPGKFGKAVQVAEFTTNLVTNPSFETGDATDWSADASGNATGTRTVVQGDTAWYGDYAYEIKKTGGDTNALFGTRVFVSLTSGTTYTFSVWVRVATYSGGTGTVFLYGSGSIPQTTVSASGATNRGWQRLSFTVTATSTGFAGLYVYVANADTMTLYVDGAQVEEKAYATPYCDGSLGAGHSWSGTAHASTSSRTGASLQYANKADLNPDEGSIMMWVRHNALRPADAQGLFGVGASNAQFDAFVTNAGSITFRQAGTSQTYAAGITPMTWYHVAFTWSRNGNTRKIFYNGVEVASRQFDTGANISTTLRVGSLNQGGPGFSVNGLVDEFVLLEYPADPKLIRAIYESDAPVFVESSVFHWRAPGKVPIWVDEFGMWARGVNGGEILGLYGGDPRNPLGNVTRSWGGITMEENDIVIGRVAGAVVGWDDSAASLLIGRPSASNLLLSGGLAQMRDGTTVYGQWSSTGLVIGQVANSRNRIEITSAGVLNIINRNSSSSEQTRISMDASGNASFTGSVTAASGNIGGFALGDSTLTAGSSGTTVGISTGATTTNVAFYAGSGTATSAPFRVTNAGNLTATLGTVGGWTLGASTLTAGAGASRVGLSTGSIAIYAGSETPSSALFQVTNTGVLTATGATISGAITATSGSFTGSITSTSGTIGGWSLASTSLTSNNVGLYSGATGTARIEVGGSSTFYAGVSSVSATGDWAFWAGQTHASRGSAPFRVTAGGALTATNATITGAITASSGSFTGVVTIGTGGRLESKDGSTVAAYMDKDGINVIEGNALNFRSGVGNSATYLLKHTSGTTNHLSMTNGTSYVRVASTGVAPTYNRVEINSQEAMQVTGKVEIDGNLETKGTGTITTSGNVSVTKANANLTLTSTSGSTTLSLVASGTGLNQVLIGSADNGTGIPPIVVIGRNSSATGANNRGGIVRFKDKDDVNRNVWADGAGVLRINADTPNQNGNISDTSGTVVGAQTSHESYKALLGGETLIAEVLARLAAASAHVRRFEYLPEAMAVQGETYEGLVLREDAPETHYYGTDKSEAGYSAGKSLNLINLCGDLLRAVVHLNERLEALH